MTRDKRRNPPSTRPVGMPSVMYPPYRSGASTEAAASPFGSGVRGADYPRCTSCITGPFWGNALRIRADCDSNHPTDPTSVGGVEGYLYSDRRLLSLFLLLLLSLLGGDRDHTYQFLSLKTSISLEKRARTL